MRFVVLDAVRDNLRAVLGTLCHGQKAFGLTNRYLEEAWPCRGSGA